MFASFILYFFFFSSRRRHTRCSRDWSSDVCSSDLVLFFLLRYGSPGSNSSRKNSTATTTTAAPESRPGRESKAMALFCGVKYQEILPWQEAVLFVQRVAGLRQLGLDLLRGDARLPGRPAGRI